MIQELAGRKKDITSTHIKLIQSVFAGETGKQIMLPYHLRAERSYDKLILSVYTDESGSGQSAWEEKIVFGQEYRVPIGGDEIYRIEFSERAKGEIIKSQFEKALYEMF